MKIVFFGSSKYSTIDEKALFEAYGLSLVVTTPQLLSNPVKQFALDNSIPVITTAKFTPEVYVEIEKYEPDFIVTADIRLILPKKLLELPKKAAINVHHSLLPKYRGPAPVPFAILSGDTTTGVSIIMISEKVDAGDILEQEIYEIAPDDTTDSVLTRLNELGGNLVVKVIKDFDEYYKNRKQQDESKASYSHYMSRNDGFIDIEKINSMSPLEIENWKLKIERATRAFYPWPGVWSEVRIKDRRLRIKFLPNKMIQVEGKKPMSYNDFVNGYEEGKEFLEKLQLI